MPVANAGFVRLVLAPGWRPGAPVWATGSGVVLVLIGLALLAGWRRRMAAGTLGAFLLVCEAQHFAYAGFVDAMVPA
ncbi:MAG: hypothetical protein QG602_165 [Verrucomicrobiota bacterium]|nr:hypothetical protein [Verrucomicrobiota bacterium]